MLGERCPTSQWSGRLRAAHSSAAHRRVRPRYKIASWPLRIVRNALLAGVTYFAIVMGVGFALGIVRVPLLVPWIGERWAELMEMPFMAAAIFIAAGYVLRRFPDTAVPGRSLVVGLLALGLTVLCELGLVILIQSQSVGQYIAGRDRVSGTAYLLLLILFALMPRLRLRTQD